MADLPSDVLAPRRSPRTINKLCNGVQMKTRNEDGDLATLSCRDTGLLLALAHCSGWSADRIKLKIKKVSGIEFKPEDIWSFHWRWVMDRGNGAMCRKDIEAMLWVLKEYGITLSELGKKPLHTTEQPISAPFRKVWTPKSQDLLPLCKGFNEAARRQTKDYLHSKPLSFLGQFSPMEEGLTMQFGTTIQRITRETLAEWAAAIQVIMKETAPYKPLKERESVIMIMEHLCNFHQKYEEVYGLMEETSTFGKVEGNAVHIQSTGYGVKVLCGLLMADRLHVIDRIRKEERERVCLERMDNDDLPADGKNCNVCQDPLDTETPEGTSEQGLKLIICCQQVIGETCLKEWLARSGPSIRKNCPNCRFDFPLCFLVKLFGEGYLLEADSEEGGDDLEDTIVVEQPREVIDLLSPSRDQSPEPPGPEDSRLERSLAPSPAVEIPDSTFITSRSLSPSPPVIAAGYRPAVGPPSALGAAFLNPVHTHIPRGADGMPDFGNAWSFGGPQVERADDFMMEG